MSLGLHPNSRLRQRFIFISGLVTRKGGKKRNLKLQTLGSAGLAGYGIRLSSFPVNTAIPGLHTASDTNIGQFDN